MADLKRAPKKAVIVAPYWCDPQHLGSVRVERYVRWLAAAGTQVLLVAGGAQDGAREEAWGKVLNIRDPLGLYRPPPTQRASAPPRPHPLRGPAYALLSPDPGVVWAWRAARHAFVAEHCAGADLVLSSSFPESAHVAAACLARNCGARLIVDLRDGWLDEPMKPLLRASWLRRLREGRLERRILSQAASILVTSEQWRQMLTHRLPFTAGKTIALTNAYPLDCTASSTRGHSESSRERPLTLLYAGRLFTSRAERRVEHLLAPLLGGLRNATGTLSFVGKLSQAELDALHDWRGEFRAAGWDIATHPAVPRAAAIDLMRQADGLLLLSASHASIPAKLFDYICAQRPILAIAPDASAVAELAAQLRQLFVVDLHRAAPATVAEFAAACRDGMTCDKPTQFDEAHLRILFLAALSS